MPDVDAWKSGAVGFFWPIEEGRSVDLDREPLRGSISLDGSFAKVESLIENVARSFAKPLPDLDGIVAITADDAMLLLEAHSSSVTRRIATERASTHTFRARTVIGAVPAGRLRSAQVKALEAHFFGVGSWAGASAVNEDRELDDRSLVVGYSVQLRSTAPVSSRLTAGRRLAVSTTWRTSGQPDQLALVAPVTIRCESSRPRDIWDLLQPLLLVQDLLSFTYRGFVAASDGSASLDLFPAVDPRVARHPALWNGALMAGSIEADRVRSAHEDYLVDLATIGGTSGLARWVTLAAAHPRAAQVVVSRYRFGRSTPEVALMETAAAIEYWVRQDLPKTKGFAAGLARHVGTAFAAWVGDPDRWAEAFRRANNRLKHVPAYDYEHGTIADLAEVGRYLLAAALLNKVARSKAPAREIFAQHQLRLLGERARRRLDS